MDVTRVRPRQVGDPNGRAADDDQQRHCRTDPRVAPRTMRRALAAHRHQHESQGGHLDELGGDADLVWAFPSERHINEVSEHRRDQQRG